jgi:hypothetical protein
MKKKREKKKKKVNDTIHEIYDKRSSENSEIVQSKISKRWLHVTYVYI